ncbi:hypothetical protein DPMN_104135 [Dreissena polymorpha]|uniref:Uncharacterized protein n=1 Tax=Dreissena polymorpha TaxID=45954 RepID=A0A9D4HCH4_DREPO|nr:hypothetical protein DPMN_104135 [Dreissena polymorpha]
MAKEPRPYERGICSREGIYTSSGAAGQLGRSSLRVHCMANASPCLRKGHWAKRLSLYFLRCNGTSAAARLLPRGASTQTEINGGV